MSKECTCCLKTKPLNQFGNAQNHNDGLSYFCKDCIKDKTLQSRRTINGLLSRIHGNQKTHSKEKGFKEPDYSLIELREWATNQPIFYKLYSNWVSSNYNRDLIPTCDRLDDYKPYTLDNIQLMTCFDNCKKGCEDRKNGINNKISKEVAQLDKNNILINVFHSINHAGRKANISPSDISKCCKGKRNYAGGYRWMHTITSGFIQANNP